VSNLKKIKICNLHLQIKCYQFYLSDIFVGVSRDTSAATLDASWLDGFVQMQKSTQDKT